MKKNSGVSIVRYLILIVVKENSAVSIVREERQCSEHSQRFHFDSSESKTA